ncbi:2446_t:CDS:2, partial [Scutellospora calospora]
MTQCLSQTGIPAGIPSFGSPPTGDGAFTNSPKSTNPEDSPFPLLEPDKNSKQSTPDNSIAIPSAVPSATVSPKATKPPGSESNSPSSGKPNTSASPQSTSSPSNKTKAESLKKVVWQEKEKACIEVSGPSNKTIIRPETVQRISWNQSPCQMEARIVGDFAILLYDSVKLVPDAKKRDYSPNGKLTYDWGPMAKVPYLNNPRITNASDFYIRVETISRSGIFGSSVPLGGIYGPFTMELKDPPEGQNVTQKEVSLASKLWFHEIEKI